jgi:hypothetical protein
VCVCVSVCERANEYLCEWLVSESVCVSGRVREREEREREQSVDYWCILLQPLDG